MENSAVVVGGINEEAGKEAMFAQLKVLCLEMLSLSQNPGKNPATIPALLKLLRRTPPSALQPFFDYTLFPLLLLLDAAVACRSQEKNQQEDFQKTPYKVSDKVAEGVIYCLEELLKKCYIRSVDQMVVIMKKLTNGAILTPSEASEEFREGIIKCFREMLSGLLPCSDESCVCKRAIGYPQLSDRSDYETQVSESLKFDLETRECLLAVLQSQSALAAVGHWLSILLKVADAEASRGHRGSAKLRVEAFMALRVLVAKIGTADVLAFFLPGVVSQIAKVLHVSRAMISGAAGSVDALDQAIRGLAEYLMIVLEDEANSSVLEISDDADKLQKHESAHSILEELRFLTTKSQGDSDKPTEITSQEIGKVIKEHKQSNENFDRGVTGTGSFHVERTKEWLESTTSHVNKLLCETFPHILIHPAGKVRLGFLAAIRGLLSKSPRSLKGARLVMLECICTLAVDESNEVSVTAQEFLDHLFSQSTKYRVKSDIIKIFNRLLERLPKVVLGNEELPALSVVKQLLVVIYYSGPQFLANRLQSPITASRFLDIFALCLSHNSAFTGSLDKLIADRPSSSTGYLPSITELKAGFQEISYNRSVPKITQSETGKLEMSPTSYMLPRMPPWFSYVGSQKLYEMLAGILRLVGLSLMAGFENEGHLGVILDIPLGYFHRLVSEVRVNGEDWETWCNRTGSGQLVRQAATAACILNEIMFGLSDQATDTLSRMLKKTKSDDKLSWDISWNKRAKTHLIDCIGKILHEYQSSEIWDLPVDQKVILGQSDLETQPISLHFLKDTAMLHQVITEGVGVFSLCLGKDFAASGFLHSSLYLLLESLTCSNFEVRNASDAVLHLLASTSGHSTVGHLVLANADYVVDSICRQLRHLDLNPHVPNVLAAILSYIGVAHEILPLLEEPMRLVSQELEIIGRQQHPNLTLPFLKAVHEIVKASKNEAYMLPDQAKSYNERVKTRATDVISSRQDRDSESDDEVNTTQLDPEEWENTILEFNRFKRYRRTVGSITSSCLTSATPLLASSNRVSCLAAIDIIDEGVLALAKVEEAYRAETETKETIEEVIEFASFYHLKDNIQATDDGSDENRLLPAINKIWPFFVACIRNRDPVTVRRCLTAISRVIQTSGGDFFSRRFRNDGPDFWKLLTSSPYYVATPKSLREDKSVLRLPYRTVTISHESSIAEVSSLKVQSALLNMIAEISSDKRSASALDAVLKKVAGLVVGIACSSVIGLRDAALNALKGLACIDPDLIWILLADVYYSLKKKELPLPPSMEFPEIYRVLPPPLEDSPARFLYVEYGGRSYGFELEFSSVETVFKKMHSLVFTDQMLC